MLSLAGKHYGEGIIKEYSLKLTNEIGKKYTERTLRRIRQFYILFQNQKWSPLATKLTWSHYQELLAIKDRREIDYYVDVAAKCHLSKRELRDRIKSKEYQRLSDDVKNKLFNKDKSGIMDFIKEPIILHNKNDYIKISEMTLKEIILSDLPLFLKQLGNGFSFIDTEYRIIIGNVYNYIDLLLFNIEFNCYVVVELKIGELKKEHLGQIQVYMNYVNENIKKSIHNMTIGIIVCREKNEYIIKYSTDKRIKAVNYEII